MGLDGFIILGAPILIGLILIVRFFVRMSTSDQSGSTPEARLQKLDSMRGSDAITEAEYQEQRRRILSQV